MRKLAITTTLVLLSAFFQFAHAQSVADAFANSYTNESNGDYAAAIKDLTAVYTESSYPMNLRLGWLYYASGDHLKSQNHYKRAIGLEKQSVEARLGYVYPTAAMENWEDVINTYEEILEIEPTNSTVNYRMGYIYFERKDLENAAKHVGRVLETYPFDYSSNYLMGQINVSQGKILEAKENLQRALYYNPTSEEVAKILKTL